MKYYLKLLGLLISISCFTGIQAQNANVKTHKIQSPDTRIEVQVEVGAELRWSVHVDGEQVIQPSVLSLTLDKGRVLGKDPVLRKQKSTQINAPIQAVVTIKGKQVDNHFRELQLDFKGDYSLIARVYNDGVAYRFVTRLKDEVVQVIDERSDFVFPDNYRVFWSDEKDEGFQSHFESLYTDTHLQKVEKGKYAALPLLVQSPKGINLLISEVDLHDYPNLFLFGSGTSRLTSGFPKVILESTPVRDRGIKITKLADYIAQTTGTRSYPWRSVAIARQDKDLLVNELNYKLAPLPAEGDWSWVKPGKVAWDWWNANNIYGVDFASGINTQTYKYYIDFASKIGLEYIMLDEGWTKSTTNLMESNPDIDIPELIRYGASKNVGIWLWCLWGPLDKDLQKILDLYASWGAKGIKVDFMARADQYMVNYYERVARAAAERKLMVNLHGAYKPVGLHTQYPNVLTYEGVRGLENNKWENTITPTHNLTLPFTRMVAGPMDYTPGAMNNVIEKNFNFVYTQPMSMGTRAHQVAMYVLYESPLQMLADNPSNYLKELPTAQFIAEIPAVWDESHALEGKVGEYAAMARRKGDTWFVGAMTDWKARQFELDLPLEKGKKYMVTIFKDGINSDKHASDHKIEKIEWTGGTPLPIALNKGGGWVGIFKANN